MQQQQQQQQQQQALEDRWYFTKEQLNNTPSVRCGYNADRELSCRQQAANFIQDMGQRLQVTQLCINTAIVYMHRFYMFHSFTQFHRTAISSASLFLAAKVEEQPRKLEHVIKVAYMCLHREITTHLDIKSEPYLELAQDLVVNENVLLQTLGFDVAIDHPHTHVVQCCRLVKASKDLAQTSYFMASNSLHLTNMCLQYKPTLVACFCIHLSMKWSNWAIPESNEGKPWFWYVDNTVTQEALEQLTAEFLAVFEKCPSRLKRKIMSMSASQNPALLQNYGGEMQPETVKKNKQDGTQPSTSGTSQHHQRPPHTTVHAPNPEENKARETQPVPAVRHPYNYKKVVPGSQHQQHHSHRDQKGHHSSHSSSSSTIPPKKNVSRPPDNMFPPPIRITDHPRPGRTEHQQQQQQQQQQPHPNQHYKHTNRQPSHSIVDHNTPDQSKQEHKMSYSSSHHHNPQHHPSNTHQPSSSSNSTYNVSKPKPYDVPPRHISDTSSTYGAPVKQEIPDQNHMYDNLDLSSLMKHEPLFNSRYENTSTSMSSSSSMKNDQSHRYDAYNAAMNLEFAEQMSAFDQAYTASVSKQDPKDHNHRFSSNIDNNHEVSKQMQVSGDRMNQYESNHQPPTHQQQQQQQQQQHHPQNHQQLHHERLHEAEMSTNSSTSAHRKELPSINNNFSHAHTSKTPSLPIQKKPIPESVPPNTVPKVNTPAASNHRSAKAPSIFSPTKEPTPKHFSPPSLASTQPSIFSPLKQQQPQTQQAPASSSGKSKRKRTSSSSNELELFPPSKRLEVEEVAVKSNDLVHFRTESISNTTIISHDVSYPFTENFTGTLSPQDVSSKTTTISTTVIETVEVGATIEIADVHDKKHKEGREHKKKKKHKEHKEHKDRERHKHKDKHKSKDKNKDKDRELVKSDNTSLQFDSGCFSNQSETTSPISNVPLERSSLKIKIPKEKLVQALPGLKVKFSKDLFQNSLKSSGKNGQDSNTNHRTNPKIANSGNSRHDSSR